MKLIYGVGYNPGGETTDSNGDMLKSYSTWRGMIERCYSARFKGINPTYEGCTVIDVWHSYCGFLIWYNENYINGYDLDKDVLISGNKMYSPDTCAFIPHKINTLLNDRGRSTGEYPKGVYYDKRRRRIMAQININGRTRFLGRFDCKNKAHNAYVFAKKEYVRSVASLYFLDGLICERVFESLNLWADNLA